jgi:hypothetical protein
MDKVKPIHKLKWIHRLTGQHIMACGRVDRYDLSDTLDNDKVTCKTCLLIISVYKDKV